jgi:hypothetical protein
MNEPELVAELGAFSSDDAVPTAWSRARDETAGGTGVLVVDGASHWCSGSRPGQPSGSGRASSWSGGSRRDGSSDGARKKRKPAHR